MRQVDTEKWVRAWVDAAKRGDTIQEFANRLGTDYRTVYKMFSRMIAIGVRLPPLTGQRFGKTKTARKLNALVERLSQG